MSDRETTRAGSPAFTASALAFALGISPQAVRKAIGKRPPDGQAVRNGRPVNAWTLLSLPQSARERLDELAAAGGYRSGEHLLATSDGPWKPPVPWNKISSRHRAKALKLQKALRYVLTHLDSFPTAAAMEARGVADYEAAFGHTVSTRHWRDLFRLVVKRDRGREEWERPEIYIAKKRIAQEEPAPVATAPQEDERLLDIDGLVCGFADPENPTGEQRAHVWVYAFEIYELMLADGISKRQAKGAIVERLCRVAHFLAEGREAMRKQFSRKLKAWQTGGRTIKALLDKRCSRSGFHRAPEWADEQRVKLLARIAICGGRISQGWREAWEHGEIGEEHVAYFTAKGYSKSYVPKSVRDMLRIDVKLIDDRIHGPNRTKHNGPWINRDWSGECAGDYMTGDDCTIPVEWWDEAQDESMRGQLLVMCDNRTDYVLGTVLISEKSYNSRDIVSLIAKIHDEYGLPRKGLYLEKGIWKARIISGPRLAGFERVEWEETERGLNRFGLRIIHANGPRPKIIERVLGAIQNQCERLPGYLGRDERHDRYERFQKAKLRVKSGRLPPLELFMSKSELQLCLDQIVRRFNHEQQEGKRLQGRSPWQAYNDLYGAAPRPRLNDDARYLLAAQRKLVTIGRNGISFKSGKEVYTYRNEITGRNIGRKFMAWFDPACPEVLSVTDLDAEEPIPFVVEREFRPPSSDPESPLLGEAFRQIAAHQRYGDRLYSIVRRDFPEDFQRRMTFEVAAPVKNEILGKRMREQREAVEADRAKHAATDRSGMDALRELRARAPESIEEARDRGEAAVSFHRIMKEVKES